MRYFQKQSPNVFCKKGVLKNFANFTGKHMFKSLFKEVAGLQACMFIKKRLQHRCFLWTLQNFQGHLFWSTSANDFFCTFEILTTNNIIFILAENFIFNFRIYKILCILYSSTKFMFPLAFFSQTISNISRKISSVWFSSSIID